MSRENVEVVQRAYEALDRGLDAALSTADEIAAPDNWASVLDANREAYESERTWAGSAGPEPA